MVAVNSLVQHQQEGVLAYSTLVDKAEDEWTIQNLDGTTTRVPAPTDEVHHSVADCVKYVVSSDNVPRKTQHALQVAVVETSWNPEEAILHEVGLLRAFRGV